jgi:alkylation response protein AidB-like acyl-CoA dehydrogenase
MIRHAVIAAILPLSLAACGSRPDGETAAAATNNSSGNYLAQISQLNEKERNGVLFRAISDAGRACQGVTRSTAGPELQGNPSWVATCDDGTPWVVSINDKGIATVTAVQGTTPKAG